MKNVAKWFVLVVFSGLLLGAASSSAQCTTTSFVVTDGSSPLTAKIVNPAGKVTGTVSASPYNIGVYFNTLSGPKKPLPPPPRPRPRPH